MQPKFKHFAEQINKSVFKGAYKCKATKQDIFQQLPKVKADLGYFDPPYIGRFSDKDYSAQYHFIDGLMVNFKNCKIDYSRKGRPLIYGKEEKFTPKKAEATISNLFSKAKHIKYWSIAYQNKAVPKKQIMIKILKHYKPHIELKTKGTDGYTYRAGTDQHITNAKEYLYVCR